MVGATTDAEVEVLFTSHEFIKANALDSQNIGEYVHVNTAGRVVGVFRGVEEDGVIYSPFKAPFGGPSIERKRERVTEVQDLVRGAIATFASQGIQRIVTSLPPTYYGPHESVKLFALLSEGFSIEACNLSYGINLSDLRSADDYQRKLNSPGRRALKHTAGLDLRLIEQTSRAGWSKAWEVLDINRSRKGRSLSMSFDQVVRLSAHFPEVVKMYTLDSEQVSWAAALVYHLPTRQDYVVYWGDCGKVEGRSTMNQLAYALVSEAIRKGRRLIDIGTSTEAGVPNDGLIQFKMSVGAKPAAKLTLALDL